MNTFNESEDPGKKSDGAAGEPTDPIETPAEVPASNDEKIDEDFPGYPHYPSKDDILNPDNKTTRVAIDVENLSRSNKIDPLEVQALVSRPPVNNAAVQEDTMKIAGVSEEDDFEIVSGTEADVTAEDLELLGPKD